MAENPRELIKILGADQMMLKALLGDWIKSGMGLMIVSKIDSGLLRL